MEEFSIAAGSAAPAIPRDKTRLHYNVMLYGESGLGKTTLMRNLCHGWKAEYTGSSLTRQPYGAKTLRKDFEEDPTRLKLTLESLECEEAGKLLHVTFQDMPGWGDDTELAKSVHDVIMHLLKLRHEDYVESEGRFPEHHRDALRGQLRHSMTVCLYFIPRHRFKLLDCIIMSAISQHIALIPIIAKADTFTKDELRSFREQLCRLLLGADRAAPGAGSANSCTKAPQAQPAAAAVVPVSKRAGKLVAPARGSDAAAAGIMSPKRRPSGSQGGVAAAEHQDDWEESMALAQQLGLRVYRFSKAALAAVNAPEGVPPFAVVASNTCLLYPPSKGTQLTDAASLDATLQLEAIAPSSGAASGQQQQQQRQPPAQLQQQQQQQQQMLMPVRVYAWGECWPHRKEHSDLMLLKELLFGYNSRSAYDLLDYSYSLAIQFAKQYAELPTDMSQADKLEELASRSCKLVAPHLENEEHKRTRNELHQYKQLLDEKSKCTIM